MNIRTDLAVESIGEGGLPAGVRREVRGKAFEITEIIIEDDSCMETLGKGRGRYITLEGRELSRFADDYEDMTGELAGELRRLIPDGEILVVGLGNNDITPDAVGPQAAAKVLATRHLRDELGSDGEDIQSFGPGLFVDCRLMPDNTTEYHDLYIMDGAKVKIDATAGHVYSKNTQLYGIVVNGNAFMGAADVDIKMHAITATMLPYGGIVGEMTGLTAFNILLDGTQLSMPFDTETADEPYVSRIYGIQGESLQRLYLRDGAKVDITINADVLRDVAEGIQSGWEWTDEDDLGIIMEEGSELNIAMNTAGMVVFGIDFTNPVSVTDAVLNVSIESSGAEIVFGMSCLDANIELNDENGSVNVSAKDGIAVFISDGADDSLGGSSGDGGHDPVTVEHKDPGDEAGLETPHGFTLADALLSGSTDYDPDYTPKHILLSGQAEIATPTDGIISRYGFPYYGNLIPGETIYDPASPDAPAQRVVISVKKKDDGSTPDPDPAHSEICPSRFFSDIDTTLWYHEAVDYVIMNRLMIGVGDNEFCPQGTITRAMIVTILHRLDGEPAVSGANPFDDVSAEQWYTDAVIWASENGIVEGYGDGKFGPMDDTTREQFATILYRYAQFKGYDVSVGEDTNVFSFNDAFDVSEWAMPAIQWACGAELMQGDDLGNLLPGNSATRAQAAALIMRFIEHVK